MTVCSAQEKGAPEAATIQALLNEVRQLRLAIERSTLTVPRMQIALQRMQMQQQRVDQLSQRVHESKAKVTAAAEENSHLVSDLQQMETRLPQEQDPSMRKQLDERIRGVKQHLQSLGAREGQQRAHEVEAAGQLQREQAKLEELGRQLAALEASLGGQASDAKAPQR